MSNLQRSVLGLLALIFSLSLAAETHSGTTIKFPALTGRVVDQVGLLDEGTVKKLEAQLKAHEAATGNQLVVVVLKDLQGQVIEDYSYQLGRTWGIGQKDKNNGALLMVVPEVRQVRIEVGYGLEGQLTDALSANIIQTVILPQFRAGKLGQGIVDGVAAIIQALGGQYRFNNASKNSKEPLPWWVVFFLPLIFLRRFGFGRGFGRHGGSRRGGFGGGGGGFGGGGASGGW